jgi:lipoate-protein ligase A
LAAVDRTVTQFTRGSGEGGWGAARADLAEWALERAVGPPERLHRLGIQNPERRLLRWCHATTAALVLGSAQPEAHVDPVAAGARGLAVVRRRSGGSSVVVGPGRVAWLDVVVPAGDPAWDDDVGIAPLWLGQVWAAALSALGVVAPSVHTGPMERPGWSNYVCFAGVGPGEVRVPAGKVVGISQRRTRTAVLFQCGALLRWDPVEAVSALAIDRGRAARDLTGVAAGLDTLLGARVELAAVEASFEQAVVAARV